MHGHPTRMTAKRHLVAQDDTTVTFRTAAAIEHQTSFIRLHFEQGRQEHVLAMVEVHRESFTCLGIARQQKSHWLGTADAEALIDFRISHLVLLDHNTSPTRNSDDVSSR